MGRFNKVTPSKGQNNSNNWKNKNQSSDRSGSTDESFSVSGNNSKSIPKRETYTKNESGFNKISPSRSNLNNQQGFKITKNPSNKSGNLREKKPFDKRTWRLQKYSKKYKLEQWEEKRKKAILRGYYKEIKDDKPKIDVKKIYEQYDSEEESSEQRQHNFVRNPNFKNRSDEDDDDDTGKEMTEDTNIEHEQPQKGQKTKNKAFNKAKLEFERLKQEKVAQKEERMKQKEEREEALKVYKKKKNEKFKKLNKKTKRGQPIMKDRIEMLLEKIQSS